MKGQHRERFLGGINIEFRSSLKKKRSNILSQ
jgi:hypothetical protein